MLLGAAGMMQHSKTEDFELQKLQLAREQSTQLKEGIVNNLILIYVVVIKVSLLVYVYTDLLKEMMIVGKSCSKFSATKDQQLLVKECGLKILTPAQVITAVDASYEISANGLWGGKFEFPENSQLISGVCHISISSSSQFNRPVTVQLEHCANITDKKQAKYLSFVVAIIWSTLQFRISTRRIILS